MLSELLNYRDRWSPKMTAYPRSPYGAELGVAHDRVPIHS